MHQYTAAPEKGCAPHPECLDDTSDKVTLPSCKSLLLLAPRLISATINAGAGVVKRTFDGSMRDEDCCHLHPYHDSHSHPDHCCHIPETHCPNPCVGTVYWYGCAGDTLQHHLEVTNTGKESRNFTLEPTPFPCTDKKVSTNPGSKTLAPGETLKAKLSFTIPEELAGSKFCVSVKIKGKYEQYLRIILCVTPRQHCCTVVEQGEIPNRVKAHYWYHHFQCVEPCFEELPRRPKDKTGTQRERA
ncbi:hypothetical protein [Hahella ganghwensis]|uniref:COG1470 family protein n=1 Tax=Hahella ganghwensis TaxID=286420 RepID=UPI00036DB99A|nr:hypothetical protein [Hahella ganghwensis]